MTILEIGSGCFAALWLGHGLGPVVPADDHDLSSPDHSAGAEGEGGNSYCLLSTNTHTLCFFHAALSLGRLEGITPRPPLPIQVCVMVAACLAKVGRVLLSDLLSLAARSLSQWVTMDYCLLGEAPRHQTALPGADANCVTPPALPGTHLELLPMFGHLQPLIGRTSQVCTPRQGGEGAIKLSLPSLASCRTSKNAPPLNPVGPFGPCGLWLRSPLVGAGAWWRMWAFFSLVSAYPKHPYSWLLFPISCLCSYNSTS